MKAEHARLRGWFAAAALLCCPLLPAQTALQSASQLPIATQSSDVVASPNAPPKLGTLANEVMPVGEAFKLITVIEGQDNLLLSWTIESGYYLYRDKLELLNASGETITATLPEAEAITDEFFGATSIYQDSLAIRLPLQSLQIVDGRLTLGLQYQGCAKDRYCYPPQQRTVELTLPP